MYTVRHSAEWLLLNSALSHPQGAACRTVVSRTLSASSQVGKAALTAVWGAGSAWEHLLPR